MLRVYNDIIASLNELKDHAEGKPTTVVVHSRASQDITSIPAFAQQEKCQKAFQNDSAACKHLQPSPHDQSNA